MLAVLDIAMPGTPALLVCDGSYFFALLLPTVYVTLTQPMAFACTRPSAFKVILGASYWAEACLRGGPRLEMRTWALTHGGACEGSSVFHVDVPGLKFGSVLSSGFGGCNLHTEGARHDWESSRHVHSHMMHLIP